MVESFNPMSLQANKTTSGRIVVHSPNWLGDAVMFLPAWRAWRDAHAGESVAVVAKRRVAGIWGLVSDVDRLVVLDDGRDGMRRAAGELRSLGGFDAICAPGSFRSALLLRRGGAGTIRGTTGQFRFLFVRDAVSLRGLESAHQSLEYARIMGVEGGPLPAPSAAIDKSRLPDVSALCDPAGRLVVLPGAARGGSKRWPPEFFAETAARAVAGGLFAGAIVCGTPGEKAECDAVAAALAERGTPCLNLCSRTSLLELASVLSASSAVLSNDSGGMHLATAVGAPVVAVFGLTDPAKTGPLGRSAAVAAEGVRHARAIPRESQAAERALRSVAPDRVLAALHDLTRQ